MKQNFCRNFSERNQERNPIHRKDQNWVIKVWSPLATRQTTQIPNFSIRSERWRMNKMRPIDQKRKRDPPIDVNQIYCKKFGIKNGGSLRNGHEQNKKQTIWLGEHYFVKLRKWVEMCGFVGSRPNTDWHSGNRVEHSRSRVCVCGLSACYR